MIICSNATIITMEGKEEQVLPCGYLVIDGTGIVEVDSMNHYRPENFATQNPKIMDCRGQTIMPGLVNSHMHMSLWRSFGDITIEKDTATQAFLAVRNGLNCLRKGITAVRDMGHKDFVHNEMKRAAALGVIPAPKIKAAVGAIEMSYGHANHFCHCVDDPYQLVAEIRRQINLGTDFIKIIASHDDLWHIDNEACTFPWFSEEDLKLAADTAHEIDTKITAHAIGKEAIRRVINAQFDSVEHGDGITEELAYQMKEQGMILIPTLTGEKENGLVKWKRGEEWAARCNKLWKIHEESFANAIKAGVVMAAGTDTLGDLNEEINLLHQFGLSKYEALKAATINGAKLIGMEDQIGSIRSGKCADFIILNQNPLDGLNALYAIDSIFINGRLLKADAIDSIMPACSLYIDQW